MQQKNDAKEVVNGLYNLLQLYLLSKDIDMEWVQQKLQEFEDTLLYNNDILVGG